MSNNNSNKHNYEFKAEMKQLLRLIIHSLYTHPEIFLRELVSNSSDALNKLRFNKLTDENIENPELELKINIYLDKENSQIVIEDTGLGMDENDLINQIGTVAKSGTLEFLENLNTQKKALDGDLIGQFGVGFYSVFMVTDEVRIETKKYIKGSKGLAWTSHGEDTFEIEEIDLENRGTRIIFTLKEEYKEFAEDWKIKEVLKKYSNFIEFPVYVNSEKVNSVTAIWQRAKEEVNSDEYNEFYKFLTNDYQEPADYLHLKIEGNIEFKSLLFVPKQAPQMLFSPDNKKTLHLYVNKVFIRDDADELLPEYLKFIKGVVETNDLPLNVSREVTQASPIFTKIRNIITGKVLGMFEDWAENDVEKYNNFYKEFGPMFKGGVNSDFSNKDRIMELLRFETTKTTKGELNSLSSYVSNMSEEQNEIYYLSGPSRESIEQNPNLEYFKKNNIEVLLLSNPADVFIVPYLFDYKGKQIKSLDKADTLKNVNEDEAQDLAAEKILAAFKEVLGDKVEDVVVSKRLVESPVTLVAGNSGMDAQLEKMMAMMDKDFSGSKKILEINPSHKLIKNLETLHSTGGVNLKLRNAINQLFDSALLMEGYLKSPADFVKRMNEFMEEATRA